MENKKKFFGSVEERNELIEYTKKAIDFASIINCDNLVFGCPKNRNIQNENDYEIALKFFKTIGEYAQQKHTVFAIEPNPTIYNTNFINRTSEALEFIKQLSTDGVKINYDLGTVIENNEDINKQAFDIVKDIDCKAVKVNVDLGTIIENNENIEIIEENIHLVNHIHISEPNLESIQKRDMHNKLKNILNKNNYDKYISIEMKNQNDIEKVKDVVNYVKGVFI